MFTHVPQLIITGVFQGIKTSALMFIRQLKETEKKHLFYSILFYSILFYYILFCSVLFYIGSLSLVFFRKSKQKNQKMCSSLAERNRKEHLFCSVLHQLITGVVQGIKTSVLFHSWKKQKRSIYSILFYSKPANYHWCFSWNQNKCIDVYSTAERTREASILFYSILFYSILHRLIITGVFQGIKTSVLMFIPQLKETEKKHLFYSILFCSILFYSTLANYHWCFSGNQIKCIGVYSTAEWIHILFCSIL